MDMQGSRMNLRSLKKQYSTYQQNFCLVSVDFHNILSLQIEFCYQMEHVNTSIAIRGS